jgi:hypothetical protein
VLVVEAGLAVIAAGVAVQSIAGYVVAGVAFVVAVALLVRRRGRGLVDLALDRLRDPADVEPAGGAEGQENRSADDGAPAPEPPPLDNPALDNPALGNPVLDNPVLDTPALDLGAAQRLLPSLHVAEVATRGGAPLGVVGDGHGFAVVLTATVAAARTWDLADAVRILTDDPARPAAVQLLIEQRRTMGAAPDPEFGPSRTYRELPAGGIPLWNRVLLVIRHEPAWAPETVVSRGGGATGARNALAAVAARTIAAAGHRGMQLRPAGPAEVAALLRDVGDPGPWCETREETWVTGTACHGVVSVPVADEAAITRVLRYAAWLDVDRSVLSVTANAIDHTLSAALRVVATDAEVVEQATAALVRDGHATPLAGEQSAGVVATLPLGGGARSLADLVNQVRS